MKMFLNLLVLLPIAFGKPSAETSVKSSVVEGAIASYLPSPIFDSILTKVLNLAPKEQQMQGCTVEITNNMFARHLGTPQIFLQEGYTHQEGYKKGSRRVPPPLQIDMGGDEGTSGSVVFVAESILNLKKDSCGILAYQIQKNNVAGSATDKVLYILWRAKMMAFVNPLENRNFFDVQLGSLSDMNLESKLKEFVTNTDKGYHSAMSTGSFMIVRNDKGDRDLLVRAHMTNSKHAKLAVSVKDIGRISAVNKRDFGITLATGLMTTTMTAVTNKIIEYLATSRVVVVTLKNTATDFALQNPVWSMNGVEIEDTMPWKIDAEQLKQISLTVPFAGGETFKEKFASSVCVLSFEIRQNGDAVANQRIAFAIKWPKKLEFANVHVHSVFMMSNSGDIHNKLEKIAKVIQEKDTELDAHNAMLAPPNGLVQTDFSEFNKYFVPYVRATKFQQYQSWRYRLTGGRNDRVLKVATMMGNREASTSLMVHMESFTTNNGYNLEERSNPSDYIYEYIPE